MDKSDMNKVEKLQIKLNLIQRQVHVRDKEIYSASTLTRGNISIRHVKCGDVATSYVLANICTEEV